MAERIKFVTSPTPLESAPRLAIALGLGKDDLLIKRDDLLPLGAGGNKIRKLQYSCAQAIAEGATTLITTGAPQSNHARLTAAAGAKLGLDVVLVLEGSEPEHRLGNLLLDEFLGAQIVWSAVADVDARAAELEEQDQHAFRIPFGGTSAISALGYADAAHELLTQDVDFDHLVVAVGSGGTMAGLVSVLGASRVLGIDSGAIDDSAGVVARLVEDMVGPGGFQGHPLRLDHRQIGSGYAHITDATRQAIALMARTEGLLLDPVYTGRAMAGLIQAVLDGDIRPGQRTIFLHSGGLPGLFGHPELN